MKKVRRDLSTRRSRRPRRLISRGKERTFQAGERWDSRHWKNENYLVDEEWDGEEPGGVKDSGVPNGRLST
ncbi:MAG: hypothetical protein ABIU05_01520 [Nitrospirales bacterium]